jgi:hypothetical protein
MPGAVNVKIAWTRPGGGAAPVITSPAFLVAGTVDTLYPSTTFTATGTAPITWSVTAGTLPAGMAFSSAGVLSGTPTATASGSITFTATNAQGADSRALTLTVNAASVVANTMSLSLPTGTATNYPYQFGRAFKQGVIANYPQVLIDEVAQTTQADVKNRWPDGSVKFAVLSLVVPSLSTSAKTLTFQNQVSSSNTPETKANMLANYDFNCAINATQSALVSPSSLTFSVASTNVQTTDRYGSAISTPVTLSFDRYDLNGVSITGGDASALSVTGSGTTTPTATVSSAVFGPAYKLVIYARMTRNDSDGGGYQVLTGYSGQYTQLTIVRSSVATAPYSACAMLGYLTTERTLIPCDSSGAFSSLSSANGQFKLFKNNTDVTSLASYSLVSQNSCTVSISATTGAYTVSGLTADTGTAVLRGQYGGETVDLTLTLVKSKAGTNTPAQANAVSLTLSCAASQVFTFNSNNTSITGAPVSARTILNAISDATLASNTSGDSPNSRYWTEGPICTTVILCDHTAKTYDFGTDANKSLRPIFHVQFWPTLSQYRVRVIVEQADTTKIQNQTYDVSLSTGNASPANVYIRTVVPQVYATRWTKTFWSGTAPAALNEVHNLAYLTSTYALPNYDATITLSGTTASNAISSWAAASKDIYDAGLWIKYMPTTGGRKDIGPTTAWVTWALYSGSSGLWQIARGMADLAAAWPMCFRSGDARTFNTLTGGAGLGRVVTRDTHPTQFLYGENGYMNGGNTTAGDKFTLGGVPLVNGSLPSTNGWYQDGAHQPEPYFAVYLTSGDYWYLEQLQFWGSWGLFISNPTTGTSGFALEASGRNPSDTVIYEQVRGQAWVFRNRARGAYASPDGSQEKEYLTRATEQALRVFEGIHIGSSPGGLAPTSGGLGDTIRNWWATYGALPSPNPLRYWNVGGSGDRDDIDTTKAATGAAPWMYSFLVTSLGIGKDLGFGASEIFSWIAQGWVSLLNEPTTNNWYILQQYRYPVKSITPNAFYQNWTDVRDAYTAYETPWTTTADLDGGYAPIAVPAVAAAYSESGGSTAWSNYNINVYQVCSWTNNPTWAIKARA